MPLSLLQQLVYVKVHMQCVHSLPFPYCCNSVGVRQQDGHPACKTGFTNLTGSYLEDVAQLMTNSWELLLLLHLFNGLFSRTTRICRYQKGKSRVGFWYGSGISWTICKQSAPLCRQKTTPAPHRSIFTGQPTVSKHWRQECLPRTRPINRTESSSNSNEVFSSLLYRH